MNQSEANKALIREGGADATGMFSKLGGNLGIPDIKLNHDEKKADNPKPDSSPRRMVAKSPAPTAP